MFMMMMIMMMMMTMMAQRYLSEISSNIIPWTSRHRQQKGDTYVYQKQRNRQ